MSHSTWTDAKFEMKCRCLPRRIEQSAPDHDDSNLRASVRESHKARGSKREAIVAWLLHSEVPIMYPPWGVKRFSVESAEKMVAVKAESLSVFNEITIEVEQAAVKVEQKM